VDPSKEGSIEGVVVDEIFHHSRGSAVGNEILDGGMEGSSGANKRLAANKRQVTNRRRSSQTRSTLVGNIRSAVGNTRAVIGDTTKTGGA
jgi:hypothetical protein